MRVARGDGPYLSLRVGSLPGAGGNMLHTKHCHAGLTPRSRLLGLEPLDILLLVPGFYVCSVVLGQLVLAVAVAIVSGVGLRLLKWGQLPGYTLALAYYFVLPRHADVFGDDQALAYPRLPAAGVAGDAASRGVRA